MATSGVSPQHLYISRNKHLPYIASYHGPWLSLPVDLLQSLLVLNAETAGAKGDRDRHGDSQASQTSQNGDVTGTSATALIRRKDGSHAKGAPSQQPAAPPLDPVIFRSLVAIRKLVDDASELVDSGFVVSLPRRTSF